jgi:hypothetical protein
MICLAANHLKEMMLPASFLSDDPSASKGQHLETTPGRYVVASALREAISRHLEGMGLLRRKKCSSQRHHKHSVQILARM